MSFEETGTLPGSEHSFRRGRPMPMLFMAYTAARTVENRYVFFEREAELGRGLIQPMALTDNGISRQHAIIKIKGQQASIEDLGSKNGTRVNGQPISGPTKLPDNAVIQIGGTLLVFEMTGRSMLTSARPEEYGIVGSFRGPHILADIVDAVGSGRGQLIVGPSGSGKELATRAIAELLGKEMLVQNAARFSSKEEAATSLFGVGPNVFTNVKAREGYIEQADGGILFLDEAHTLPRRLQKSLLRVIEDKWLARIGETTEIPVDVNFVLASNEPPPRYGLARDLLARLRVIEVPALKDRRADIPDIFDHLYTREVERLGVPAPPPRELFNADHYGSLMIDGFLEDNVRGLHNLAERVVTRIAAGSTPKDAALDIFSERYGREHLQTHEQEEPPDSGLTADMLSRPTAPPAGLSADHVLVREAYYRQGGNVSAIECDLRDKGIDYSRRRIAKLIDQLGLPRLKK